uniref:Uncharacterized protein n=1 Tax=Karlodinium veneficum TaxID=407301 RepID=A7WPZ4_KARVE|nr:unknown [Karlodinium veneficum]
MADERMSENGAQTNFGCLLEELKALRSSQDRLADCISGSGAHEADPHSPFEAGWAAHREPVDDVGKAVLRLQKARAKLADGLSELQSTRGHHDNIRAAISSELRQATSRIRADGETIWRGSQPSS